MLISVVKTVDTCKSTATFCPFSIPRCRVHHEVYGTCGFTVAENCSVDF